MRVADRILPVEEWPLAEATLAGAYCAVRRAAESVLGDDDLSAYVELTPRR